MLPLRSAGRRSGQVPEHTKRFSKIGSSKRFRGTAGRRLTTPADDTQPKDALAWASSVTTGTRSHYGKSKSAKDCGAAGGQAQPVGQEGIRQEEPRQKSARQE